jgi:hypothetical protein
MRGPTNYPVTNADCIAELHLLALDAHRADGADYCAIEDEARDLLNRARLAGGAFSDRQRDMMRDAYTTFNWFHPVYNPKGA